MLPWDNVAVISVFAGAVTIVCTALYQQIVGNRVFGKAKKDTLTLPAFRKSVGDHSGALFILISPMIATFGTNFLMKLFLKGESGCCWMKSVGFHVAVWGLVQVPRLLVEFAAFRISVRVLVSWMIVSLIQAIVAGVASQSLV
jgi:hypothetical protein